MLKIFKEIESNSIAQNVALIYEKLFGVFCFILMFLSIFPTVILYEMGADQYYPSMLDINKWNALKSVAIFISIWIALNLVLIFIFGILATFISINSYLRQISQIPTITKGNKDE